MFGTILVPLDGTPFSERALPFAAHLASVSRGRLVLLQSVPSSDGKSPEEREARVGLARLAADLRRQDITVDQVVYHDLPTDAVLRSIRSYTPDIVVMCTHARGEVQRWYHGSCADEVVRFGNVPVLLIPPECQVQWSMDTRFEEVLVAVDGSEFAVQGLDPATRLAGALGCGLTLFFVVPPAVTDGPSSRRFAEDDPAVRAIAARKLLEEQVARLHARGIRAEVETEIGHPEVNIARRGAAEGVAAIGIATHGRSGILRTVMGSTATAILCRATTPLLVMRPQPVSPPIALSYDPSDGRAGSIHLTTAEQKAVRLALVELLDRLEPKASLADTAEAVLLKLGESEPATKAL